MVEKPVVRPAGHKPWDIDCQSANDGMTKQSFKDEADINKIIARFERTGMVDSFNGDPGWFGDVSGVLSYKDALDVVSKAEAGFMELPADLREHFGNDPAKLIEFLNEPKNRQEAIELGLIPKPTPAPVEAPVGPPASPQGASK